MNRQSAILIILASIGLILAFPPFPTGIIAILVIVPFFFFLRGKGIGIAFIGGYLLGLVWATGTIYWIGWATGAGVIGAVLFVPLTYGFYGLIQSWLWKQWGDRSFWMAPFLWTGLELIAGSGVLGFPWLSLSNTQTQFPVLIQYASITGMYGVTFWVVLANVIVFNGVRAWQKKISIHKWISALAVLLIIPMLHGVIVTPSKPSAEKRVKVSLVQGNIDPYKKWTPSFIDSNFVVYERMTWQAGQENPDLIIWPETATPCYLRYRYARLRKVRAQVDSLGIPLLTGSPDYEWVDRSYAKKYNGALLIHPNSWRVDRYEKINLVPFSERVPFAETIPFLYDMARKVDSGVGDFAPGDSITVFEAQIRSLGERVKFGTVICYESAFPYLVRKFVKQGAQFLVIITNDGWFGNTSGPYQHARMAILRAIENRSWIARCANTGISEFIDPHGRIHQKTQLNEEAILTGTVGLLGRHSIFVRYGLGFPIFIGLGNACILLTILVRKHPVDSSPYNREASSN